MNEDNILKNEILRFCTIGSVDDGKSTLIGRLFYEAGQIPEDQLKAIEEYHRQRGEKDVNLAMFTDGLKSEREQGITIDVAYRYFKTNKRKFIIADCPGHLQYTRNMITGASGCNMAILLVDASKGFLEQTIRHAFLVSMLQIKHLVICINKMDLIDYDQKTYLKIRDEMTHFLKKLDIPDIHFLPLSAVTGENILKKSANMPWYEGPTLFYLLENTYLASDYNSIDARMPIQMVWRETGVHGEHLRHYFGRVESGTLRKGDEVCILPSGFRSKITRLFNHHHEMQEVTSPFNCGVELEDELDISRGDMLVRPNNLPQTTQEFDALICWLGDQNLQQTNRYTLMHTTREVACKINQIYYKIDINSLHKKNYSENESVAMNDISKVRIRTSSPLFVDQYKKNRNTGHFIIVDNLSNDTVGAGLVV